MLVQAARDVQRRHGRIAGFGAVFSMVLACSGDPAAPVEEPSSGSGDAEPCADSTPCDGKCVDLATDDDHCGGCNLSCAAGSECVEGDCVLACASGEVDCGTECADLASNAQHCGACGNACDRFDACASGQCTSCVKDILGPALPHRVTGTVDPIDRFEAWCTPLDGPEVVYGFVAPRTGSYLFDATESPGDTAVYVLNGACNGERLACSAAVESDVGAFATAFLEEGQAVIAIVEQLGDPAGDLVLSVRHYDPDADCCRPGNAAGCRDVETAHCVCAADPYCCSDHWDSVCVRAAREVCDECSPAECDPMPIETEDFPATLSRNTAALSDHFSPPCTAVSSPDAAYAFTAPRTDTYRFDTRGSTIDAALYALSSDCNGAELACNDDVEASTDAEIVIQMEEGETVIVVVDGARPESGVLVLNVNEGPVVPEPCCSPHAAPGCDNPGVEGCVCATFPHCCQTEWDSFCAEEVVFGGCYDCSVPETGVCRPAALDNSVLPLDVEGDTSEWPNSIRASCAFASRSADAVYSFVAPQHGVYSFDTVDSDLDTVLALFENDCAGREIACNDDEEGRQSRVTAELEQGDRVVVVVESNHGVSGDFVLHVEKNRNPDELSPCCFAQETAGCGDATLEECVCATAPECCEERWDTICADSVESLECGTCH